MIHIWFEIWFEIWFTYDLKYYFLNAYEINNTI